MQTAQKSDSKSKSNRESQGREKGLDFKLTFILIGLVVALTIGLYHAFNWVLRLVETRHRNGERLMDLMGSRLNEQDKNY